MIEVANVLRVLRNIDVKEKVLPVIMRELTSKVLETGYVHNISRLPKVNPEGIGRFAETTELSKMIDLKEAT